MKNMTIEQFAMQTASNEPVPGGGSISALAGALAAALTEMVAGLTIGKKKYAEVEEEMKGHNILAVERFQDSTRWMIEFSVLRPCSYGSPGDEMRLFLTEDGYQAALVSQKRREIKIKRYARVIEGHVLDFKPDKRRRHP